MKTPLMAIGAAALFAVGIGVGVALSGGGDEQVAGGPVGSAGGNAPDAPRVEFAEGTGSITPPEAIAGATPDATPEPSDGSRSGGEGNVGEVIPFPANDIPPPPPPPVPTEGLEAEQDLRRRLDDPEGEKRDGRVRTLVYDFESEEERLAWEKKHRERWETRLEREIELKIKLLREKIGLQAHQERDLRQLLQDEYEERGRLVAQLTAKEITRSAFDDAVRANVAKAQARLEQVLTAEQMTVYQQLKPREKVLQEGTK
jgi:hypothetical protein